MRTIRLGSMAGIPVKANWGALAIAALFGFVVATGVLPEFAPSGADSAYVAGGLIAGFALLGSILVHEAAHALVARRYEVEVSSITLWLFGGVAHLEGEAPSPRAEARIAGSGPLSSLILGAVFVAGASALTGLSPVAGATLLWIGGLNLLLAVFNLLPGAPLDGGRLLHAWLWKRSGDRSRATVGAARAGRGVGAVIAGLGVFEVLNGGLGGLWTTMIGLFLYNAAGQEARFGQLAKVLEHRTVEDLMSPLPEETAEWTSVSDIISRHRGADIRLLVVDFSGNPTGVVTSGQLFTIVSRLPHDKADGLAMRDLGLPRPVAIAADRPATDALRHGGVPVLVTRDDKPIGVITSQDLAAAVALHNLRATPTANEADTLAA